MPVILPRQRQDEWLLDIKSDSDREHIKGLSQPLPEGVLKAYTVARLLGKEAIGNVPEVEKEVIYPELVF